MEEVMLERMTWPEVAAALESGKRTAIVACGAVEQHGPQLPLLTDAAHASRLAVEVARRLGDALVAPTIRVGCSEHHMHFPGTISIQATTLEALYRDTCTSLARHGFRRICVFSAHGGNFAPLEEMVEGLREAVGPDVEVVVFTDLLAVIGMWRRVVEEETGLGERVGGHADIAESSVMLVLHPELVREERAVAGYVPALERGAIDEIIARGFHTVSPTGVLGDARGMTRRIGERCIAEMVELLVGAFA